MKPRFRTIMEVRDLQDYPAFQLVLDTQDVIEIARHLSPLQRGQGYDAFFTLQNDGEFVFIYGMHGTVAHFDKKIYRAHGTVKALNAYFAE
jgi:hypothetical protein